MCGISRGLQSSKKRFSRSTSISVAVLALSFAGRAIAGSNESIAMLDFKINIVICCLQITLFLIYSWALNRQELSGADRNYVQITLLTSAFLGDTCWNLAQATDGSDMGRVHHQLTAYVLGSLWLLCFLFWIVKLKGIIRLQRPEPSPNLVDSRS
jgi:hypothetical protein